MTADTDRPAQHGQPDLLAVVHRLRPTSEADQLWDPQEQAAARDRILAAGRPVDELAGRRRKRRPLAVLAFSGAVLVAGTGAAAAGGLMPQAFTDALSNWSSPSTDGGPGVDPANAKRTATAPGPDGTVFTVLTAAAAQDPDYTCTVALFETKQSAAGPGPAAFEEASSNWCQQGPATGPFGAGGLDVFGDYYVYYAVTGDAVRAELHTASGQAYPVVTSGGNFFGWYPAPAAGEGRAELVGYAADGTEVGRTVI